MEKYPFLNQAVANVLSRRRRDLGMSKRKLSELAMMERAYITGIESARWNISLNGIFFLCDALQLDQVEFARRVKRELKALRREAEELAEREAEERAALELAVE